MCLGVPGRIVEISASGTGLKMGSVSFSGTVKDVCLEYLPGAAVGDHVIVHLGFALSRLDEEAATQILMDLEEMSDLADAETARPD
jgi:hydrogenase expression/formation protein HypC